MIAKVRKAHLPYAHFRPDRPGWPDSFRLRGRVWTIEQVNREGRPVQIRSDEIGISFGTAKAWRGWVEGDWRYM